MVRTVVGLIPVIDRDRIRFNLFENCYRSEVSGDYCIRCNFSFSAFDDPFYELLAGYKWRLRHSLDPVALSSEVLGECLLYSSVIVQHDELYGVHVSESSLKFYISIDYFAAGVLCLSGIPADKLMTFLYRSCWKFNRSSLGVFISLICFLCAVEHVFVGHSKVCSLILGPDSHIAAGRNAVGEVSAAVYPFPGVSVPDRYLRDIVQAIAGVDVDRPRRERRCSTFILIESDGVGDLGIVRNYNSISSRYIAAGDPVSCDLDLRALCSLDDLAESPVSVIVLTGNRIRHLAADRFTLGDFYCFVDFRVSVVESHGPGGICCPGRFFNAFFERFLSISFWRSVNVYIVRLSSAFNDLALRVYVRHTFISLIRRSRFSLYSCRSRISVLCFSYFSL